MENITLTVSSEPVFTRYLYIKPDVYASLYTAIVDKKRNEALFWAYELYYSGFGYEMVGFLESTSHTCVQRKNIQRFIDTCINNWRVHKHAHLIATIVTAIITANTIAKIIYIHYSEKDIAEFQTVKVSDLNVRHWKVLQIVCRYATTKKDGVETVSSPLFQHHYTRDEYTQFFRGEWEYYAYFTPVWKQRFETYGGEPDHAEKKINWTKKDEITEMFYEKFGYEPDEQPVEIFHKLIHC